MPFPVQKISVVASSQNVAAIMSGGAVISGPHIAGDDLLDQTMRIRAQGRCRRCRGNIGCHVPSAPPVNRKSNARSGTEAYSAGITRLRNDAASMPRTQVHARPGSEMGARSGDRVSGSGEQGSRPFPQTIRCGRIESMVGDTSTDPGHEGNSLLTILEIASGHPGHQRRTGE